MRRATGILMLLLTVAPLAAALAKPAADRCVMCAVHCCCRPAAERGSRCRISGPCAPREPGSAPATPATRVIAEEPFTVVLPDPSISDPSPPLAARALRMAAVPPDPPPRRLAA
jgi:hypothetical protein